MTFKKIDFGFEGIKVPFYALPCFSKPTTLLAVATNVLHGLMRVIFSLLESNLQLRICEI